MCHGQAIWHSHWRTDWLVTLTAPRSGQSVLYAVFSVWTVSLSFIQPLRTPLSLSPRSTLTRLSGFSTLSGARRGGGTGAGYTRIAGYGCTCVRVLTAVACVCGAGSHVTSSRVSVSPSASPTVPLRRLSPVRTQVTRVPSLTQAVVDPHTSTCVLSHISCCTSIKLLQ